MSSIRDTLQKMKDSGPAASSKVRTFTDTRTEAEKKAANQKARERATEVAKEKYGGINRVKSTLSGAAKGSGSAFANAFSTLYAAGQGGRTTENQALYKEYAKNLETAKRDYKVMQEMGITGSNLQAQKNIIDDAQRKFDAIAKVVNENVQEKATQAGMEEADRLSASSEKDLNKAKTGLGTIGKAAVDIGAAGAQMLGDIAAGAATGGGALAPMAVRSFGSGAQEARQSGATLGQQMAYGAGSGVLSVATEKLSSVAAPFKKAFGSGVLDKAIEKAAGKLAQNAAGKAVLSALSEGGEEVVESLVQPILQRATYDPEALKNYGNADYWADTLYQGLIGGALGLAGSGVEAGQNAVSRAVSNIGSRNASPGSTEAAGTPAQETAGQRTTQQETPSQSPTDPLAQVIAREAAKRTAAPETEQTQTVDLSKDPLLQALFNGKRVAQTELNDQQFSHLADRGDMSIDAAGEVYQVNPENHIDQRTQETVSDKHLNAFQFDHPELQSYYKQAAEALIADADLSLQVPMSRRYERTMQGNKTIQAAQTSQALRTAMDKTGLTRSELIDAAQRIINDKGQENVAAAKRVELILDQMLTNGWTPMAGETVAPNQDYIAAKQEIAGYQKAAPAEELPIWDMPEYDNLGSARQGFTTAGMEGTEQTSRIAQSFPYNQYQEAATGLSREDYAKIFRYQSQTEGQSLAKAEDLLYFIKDGKRTFLRDIDETAFQELVKSLDEATAWNGPQMDAARMIQSELQGRSVNLEIPQEEYTDFLRIFKEHETSTGQGIQANAKWSRADNRNGKATELDAWENLENNDKLSSEERKEIFRRIVKWDTQIEQATNAQQLKDIILEVAQERGTLNGLSGRQSRILQSVANKSLNALSLNELKQFAYASTSAMSTDGTPAGVGQKVKTVQILNMLSNPKTAARNLTGNTTFYGVDALAMDGASLLDMALSKITGTRSVAFEKSPLSRSTRAEAVKAMQMAIAEITMDVDMGGGESRYGTGSRRTFKANGNFADRVLSMLERNQAYLLNATDELYKGAARSTALETQKLIDQGKIKTEDKNYAKNQAEQLAKYRTFQDNSYLSDAIQNLHDLLNSIPYFGFGDSGKTLKGRTVHAFGPGDIVAPFTRVAGNLASRGIEYSPLNAAKGAVEIAQTVANAARGGVTDPTVQAKAVSDFARGMTGTALAYGFMVLAKAGLLRQADDENDENVAALNQSEGMTGTQLNLSAAQRTLSGGSAEWQDGDTLIDLSSVEPLNLLMNLGTEMAKDDGNAIIKSLKATGTSFLDATADLPVVQGVGDFAKDVFVYGNNPVESAMDAAASTAVSSVIPNILRSAAKGMDDRPRYTYSGDTLQERVTDNIKNSIPVLRETLPGSVNPFGEEKTYQGDTLTRLINSMLNPVGVNTYTQSEVSKELETLRGQTGETSFYPSKSIPSSLSYTDDNGNSHSVSMDYEQRQDYQRDRGSTALLTMADMMGTSAYKSAGTARKAELMDLCKEYAFDAAKANILGDESVSKWVTLARDAQKELGMSTAEYLAAYSKYGSEIMSSGIEKTKEALDAGLTLEEYAGYKDSVSGLTADKDADGNSISGSKKAKVVDSINSMDLSAVEKDWLYLFNGYAESGLSDTPWR